MVQTLHKTETLFDLNEEIIDFLRNQKDIIEFAGRTNPDEFHYCIVLKSYTPEIQQKLWSFLLDYEKRPYAQLFPVYFELLPPEYLNQITVKEVIAL